MSDVMKSSETRDENISIDAKQLMNVAQDFVNVLGEQQNNNHKAQMRRADIEEKHLETDKMVFKYRYWFGFVISVFIIGISVGLIFFKDDKDTGIQILSHVVAVGLGAIGGAGWQKSKKGTS